MQRYYLDSDELSCPTSIAGRTPVRNILTIPSGPTSFSRRNIGTNPASAWHLVVNEAMVKQIQRVVRHNKVAEARRQLGKGSNWYVILMWTLFYYMPVGNKIIRNFVHMICRKKFENHLCIKRQCHTIISMKSCVISDVLREVWELSAWPLTNLLLFLKPVKCWLQIVSCVIFLEKKWPLMNNVCSVVSLITSN